MINNDQISQFSNLVDPAQTVLIVYQEKNSDTAAAAAALSQGLQQLGKSVTLATPRQSQFVRQIPDLQHARTEIGNQYLSVSFEYSETAVDKVSYHIGEETGRFYLTIKPKPGEAPLDASSVEFSYTGVSADVLVLIGVQRLEDLEQLYNGYEDTYANTPTVAIDSSGAKSPAVSVQSEASVSQTVAELLQGANIAISGESATHLLRGIEEATQQFSSLDVTPETFEMVAQLMRQGGKRTAPQPQPQTRPPQNQPKPKPQPQEVRPEPQNRQPRQPQHSDRQKQKPNQAPADSEDFTPRGG